MLTAKQDKLLTAIADLHTEILSEIEDSISLLPREQKIEAIKRLDASVSLLWEIYEILEAINKGAKDE